MTERFHIIFDVYIEDEKRRKVVHDDKVGLQVLFKKKGSLEKFSFQVDEEDICRLSKATDQGFFSCGKDYLLVVSKDNVVLFDGGFFASVSDFDPPPVVTIKEALAEVLGKYLKKLSRKERKKIKKLYSN